MTKVYNNELLLLRGIRLVSNLNQNEEYKSAEERQHVVVFFFFFFGGGIFVGLRRTQEKYSESGHIRFSCEIFRFGIY